MSTKLANQRGDTLVEVLIAMAVLAIVTVGSFSLMNKGVGMMYDSMERSEVRLLIGQQIDSLMYARDEYLQAQIPGVNLTGAPLSAKTAWQAMKDVSDSATPAANNCTVATNAFSIGRDASNNLKLVLGATPTATGFPAPGDGVSMTPGNGIWIQKIAGTQAVAQVPYVDFYIRACWAQNSSAVTQVESSVVRLYDK